MGIPVDSRRLLASQVGPARLVVRQLFPRAFVYTPRRDETGAHYVFTGEAAKKDNAAAISALFAQQAGKFVCATAGPNLEAVMAAYGSGACGRSAQRTRHQLEQTPCHEEARVVARDNTVTLDRCVLQISKQRGRRTCAELPVLGRRHLDGRHSVWWGRRCLGRYDPGGRPLTALPAPASA